MIRHTNVDDNAVKAMKTITECLKIYKDSLKQRKVYLRVS